MIAASDKQKAAIDRWRWFSKSVRFDSCAEKQFVFCKFVGQKLWRLRRLAKCAGDAIVERVKTERNIETKFANVPGVARISVMQLARHSSDVRAMMDITDGENIYRRNKDTRAIENVKFGDVHGGDYVFRRVSIAPEWGQERIDNCEYNDYIAIPDWRRVCKAAMYFLMISISIGVSIFGICRYCRTHVEAPIQTESPQDEEEPPKDDANTNNLEPPNAANPKNVVHGYENGVAIVSMSVRTNNAGAVIEKLKLADGTSKTKVYPKPPLFENPCDQVIAMSITTKPGDSMPPLPDLAGIDRDFANSLLSPIVITDDDNDEEKNIKEMVIEVRKMLAEEVKNGRSVMDVLLEHQNEMNKLYERRLDAILMMQKISAEEGIEAAQEFADAVNDEFEESGIPAIPVIGRGRNQKRND